MSRTESLHKYLIGKPFYWDIYVKMKANSEAKLIVYEIKYNEIQCTLLLGQFGGVLLAISTNTFVVVCWHLCLMSSTSSASNFFL